MIRGIQKQMIWVQTAQSHYFEGAYFVMRTQACREQPKENEMLREANRILEEQALPKREKSHACPKMLRRASFWLGVLLGSVGCALLGILVILCV